MQLREKAKTKVAHHLLIKLAFAVVIARLYGTLGGSLTSVGAQADPLPPGSFVGRARELSESCVGLSNVTAGHGHLFPPSGGYFLILFARFKSRSLRTTKAGSNAAVGCVSRNWRWNSASTDSENRKQSMVEGR